MNDNLNKPTSIVRAEFIENLADLINGSMLPAFVIEPILKDMYIEIKSIAQKQYEFDLQKYEQLKTKKESLYEEKNEN